MPLSISGGRSDANPGPLALIVLGYEALGHQQVIRLGLSQIVATLATWLPGVYGYGLAEKRPNG